MSDLVQKINSIRNALRYASDDASGRGADYMSEEMENALDDLKAIRQALGSTQERGEAVAPVMWQYRVYHTDLDDSGWGLWHDCHDASTATRLQSSEGYQVRHLYAAPTDAQSRIAELEAQLAQRTAAVIVSQNGQALACSEPVMFAFAHLRNKLETAEQALTESREREGRMREALQGLYDLVMHPSLDADETVPQIVKAKATLAAEKEQK